MSMKFENRLKGSIAVELVSLLLSDAGCQVIRCGVEEQIPALKSELKGAWTLPRSMTSTPDLIVVPPDKCGVRVEVKYRASWTKKVRSRLFNSSKMKEQVHLWEPLILIIVVGDPFDGKKALLVGDHIRIMPLHLNQQSNLIEFHRFIRGSKVVSVASEALWDELVKLSNSNFFREHRAIPQNHDLALRLLTALT